MSALALPVQDMLTMIRLLVDDEQADAFTDANLLMLLNQAEAYYALKRSTQARNVLMASKDLTHDGTTELFRIAPYMPLIISVERTDVSPREEIQPIDGDFRRRFGFLSGTTLNGGPYYMQGNQMGITPIASSAQTTRVWYAVEPAPFHYGTLSAGGATSLTFAAAPDGSGSNLVNQNDAYNERQLMITTANVREVNVCSDYVASTRVATMANTWTTTPTTNQYSLLSTLPPMTHMLLVYWVIEHGRMKLEDPAQDVSLARVQLERELMKYIGNPSRQRNRRVTMYGWDN